MPEKKLICPYCGHDGTRETARSALESHGFNYLQDDVVCRDVRGYDDEGKIQLAREFKCEGVPGTAPRIECRACWQTFPLPEGMEWVLFGAEAPPPTEGAPPEAPPALPEAAAEPAPQFEAPPALPGDFQPVAQRMTEDLLRILKVAVDEVRRLATDDLKMVCETVAGVVGEIQALRQDVAAVREQVDSLRDADKEFSFRLARMEARLHGHEEIYSKTQEELEKISALQEETRQSLGSQSGVIGAIEQVVRQLGEIIRGQQEQQDQRNSAATADLAAVKDRLEALDRRSQDHAAAAEGLNRAWSKLEESHEVLQKRLDAQAEAIRTVHLATQAQAGRKEELRAALQRLEEIAGGLDQPRPLPQDL